MTEHQHSLPSPALVQHHLHGVHYPASRDDLISYARGQCEGGESAVVPIRDCLQGCSHKRFRGNTIAMVSESRCRRSLQNSRKLFHAIAQCGRLRFMQQTLGKFQPAQR